ncbi:MAG: sugar porter family MFS transporter [Candidatus Thermoplasmatota archaeon]|uniref:MFS transporter n=1 Tax=Ferroplasma sp. TaxID=2591003 RepID=UPI00262D5E50|nr:MFS transporter [Ferroplasma sp.]MCL4312091.1 sugar porter family MFS transporter [Candidatus Thermoplasmatota archaeon]
MGYNALDNAKMNSLHKKITALSVGGTFLDGYDISIISVALIVMSKPVYGLTTDFGRAMIAASTVIGMLFGAILFGYITDLYGRRTMYMYDMVLFIILTAAEAFSWNFASLFIMRFILGLGLGADYAIGTTIIGEFSPVKYRGKLLVTNVLSWFLGAAVASISGFLLLPLGNQSWRYMFLLGIIPAVIILILRRDVPESARWLANKGKTKEAADVERELTGTTDNLAIIKKDNKNPLKELLSRKYLKSLLFVGIFWFTFDASFYGISIFSPTILELLGLKARMAVLGSAVFDMFAILGSVIAILLIDRIGRKGITIIGFSGMVVSLAALGIITFYVPNKSAFITDGVLIFAMFLIFYVTEAIGPGSTDFVYPIELFPTEDRATAQGFGTSVSRIGAILGITTFPFIVSIYGFSTSLFFFTGLSVIGLLATVFLATETKGKTLEEINEIEEGKIKAAKAGAK